MKNIVIITITLCISAVACKKEKHTPVKTNPPVVKYAAKFQLTLLQAPTDNINTDGQKQLYSAKLKTDDDTVTLAARGITNYYYIAYDHTGKEVSRIHRNANSPGTEIKYINDGKYTAQSSQLSSTTTTDSYNMVSDSLPAGDYTIVVVAAASGISINTSNESQIIYNNFITGSAPFFNYIDGSDQLPYPNTSDTYITSMSYTSGANPTLTQASLERIVGQLEINIEDAIPANADHFRFVLDGETKGTNFNGTPVSAIDTSLTTNVLINSTAIGKINYQYTTFIINTSTPINVSINCYDASNKLIGSKSSQGIQFKPLTKTILSGKLFVKSVGGHINVDPGFGADSTVVNF